MEHISVLDTQEKDVYYCVFITSLGYHKSSVDRLYNITDELKTLRDYFLWHWSSSYLWKITFSINHQKRCFPAASISNNHNFQFTSLFYSTVTSPNTVLSHFVLQAVKQTPGETGLKILPPDLHEIHSNSWRIYIWKSWYDLQAVSRERNRQASCFTR